MNDHELQNRSRQDGPDRPGDLRFLNGKGHVGRSLDGILMIALATTPLTSTLLLGLWRSLGW